MLQISTQSLLLAFFHRSIFQLALKLVTAVCSVIKLHDLPGQVLPDHNHPDAQAGSKPLTLVTLITCTAGMWLRKHVHCLPCLLRCRKPNTLQRSQTHNSSLHNGPGKVWRLLIEVHKSCPNSHDAPQPGRSTAQTAQHASRPAFGHWACSVFKRHSHQACCSNGACAPKPHSRALPPS